jgi:hypothetical protein
MKKKGEKPQSSLSSKASALILDLAPISKEYPGQTFQSQFKKLLRSLNRIDDGG